MNEEAFANLRAGGVRAQRFGRATDELSLDPASAEQYARFLAAMLDADSPAASLDAALAGIGARHGADRCYLLDISHADERVSILHEWTAKGKVGIRRTLSDQPLSRFPLVRRFMRETVTVLVSRPSAMPASLDGGDGVWRYALAPVERTRDRTVLLCVDNPRAELSNWAATEAAVSHILHALKAAERTPNAGSSSSDPVNGLPDTIDFERRASLLSAGTGGAAGVLAVRLPRAAQDAARTGVSHVVGLMCQMVDVLKGAFEGHPLFHTDDAEFSVMAAGVGREGFAESCADVRERLLERCAGEFQLGSAWTDGVCDVQELLRAARAAMERDDGRLPADADAVRTVVKDAASLRSPATVGLALPEGLTLTLQPVFRMDTRELTGAEILARTVGSEGALTLPSEVFSILSSDDAVRTLDYAMLDMALALQERWQAEWTGAVPLAVNLSPETLASPTLAASLLAVLSRHPGCRPEQVRLDVRLPKESEARKSARSPIARIRELGLHATFDGFGTCKTDPRALDAFAFDAVKIDRSVVERALNDGSAAALVHNAAGICDARGMACVANGVETQELAQTLMREGCLLGQGFHFSRPVSVAAFERSYLAPKTAK